MTLLGEITESNVSDRAIVETLVATGLRVGELLNIKLQDIDWKKNEIRINSGHRNERIVQFGREGSILLKSYLLSREILSDYLFADTNRNPLSQSSITYRLHRYSEKIGFKVTPRVLRHTFVMKLVEKGISIEDISLLLGNLSITTSAMLYRKIRMTKSV